MTLSYSLDMSDVLALRRNTLETNMGFRRKVKRGFVIFLSLGVASLVAFAITRMPIWAILGVYLGIVAYLWTFRRIERYQLKLFRREMEKPANSLFFIERDTTFSHEGLHTVSESFDEKVEWSAVARTEETDEHFFIYISEGSAYVIPKRAATTSELDQLREFIAGNVKPAQ